MSIDSLQLGSIAAQNNEKVQNSISSSYIKTYLNHFEKIINEGNIQPAHISFISSIIRTHQKNRVVFTQNGGVDILLKLLARTNIEKVAVKGLFLYTNLIQDASKVIPVEPLCLNVLMGTDSVPEVESLAKLFPDSIEWTRQFLTLFTLLENSWAKDKIVIIRVTLKRLLV